MRPLGGYGVLLEQLQELHDLATAGKIAMRVLRFESVPPMTNNATFDLLTLQSGKDGERKEVVYVETGLQDSILEDRSVRRYHDRFDKIWNVAATEEETIEFVADRIKQVESRVRGSN